MGVICSSYPRPTDDFGVLWALGGIKDAAIIEHGPTGTTYFNSVVNFGAINRQYPKGVIFTTGLEQEDVVMGNEGKLMKAVKEIDDLYGPEVIFLVATAVTSLIGTDLDAVVSEMQPKVKARLFAFSGGGLRGSYALGIKEVFNTLASKLVADPETRDTDPVVNIIGPTIESFNHASDSVELQRLLSLLGLKVNAVFTNGSSVKEIRNASRASLNLVTRDMGIESAEILRERFHIPGLRGMPFGIKGTIQWLEKIAEISGIDMNRKMIAEQVKKYGLTITELTSGIWRQDFSTVRVVISCPYDYALGLVGLLQEDMGLGVALVCLPIEPEEEDALETLKRKGVPRILISPDEEDIRTALKETSPHILFGSEDMSRMAPDVPIHIRASLPSYDRLNIYDGTPFIGFRGTLFLTQTMVNSVNAHKEVLL